MRKLFLVWTLRRCTTTWPRTSTPMRYRVDFCTQSTVCAAAQNRPWARTRTYGGTPCTSTAQVTAAHLATEITAPDPNRGERPSLRCWQPRTEGPAGTTHVSVHDVNGQHDMAQHGGRSCVSWRRVRTHVLGGGVRGGASPAPVTTCDGAALLARKPHTERQGVHLASAQIMHSTDTHCEPKYHGGQNDYRNKF